jgi:hypothetical protein
VRRRADPPRTWCSREGHGFRQADNIVRAIEAELWFYGHVPGFGPADDIEPVEVVDNVD